MGARDEGGLVRLRQIVKWGLALAAAALVVVGLIVVLFPGEEERAPSTMKTPPPVASRTGTFTAPVPTTPAPPSPTMPAPPPGAMGISENLADLTSAELRQRVGVMKANGVSLRRFDIRWDTAARKPGSYNYSRVQPAAEAVGRAGIGQVAILGYAPGQWAGAGLAVCGGASNCSPADTPQAVAAYADFVGHTARTFCGPSYDLRVIEIWNEPNISKYWPLPNAALYTKYLKAGYEAVKANCPRLQVLPGGLGDLSPEQCPDCISSVDFLRQVYEHGGRGFFDAVSSHAYDPAQPERLHAVMERYGDGGKKVWVTEFAYSGVAPQDQANYAQQTVTRLRQYPWIGPLFWLTLQDRPGDREKMGLIDEHGKAKPVLDQFKQLADAA